jgi:predicted LPLAT superfamily acyltransferase
MRPPFARFVVNEAMAKRQATASQVCLTIHMADKSEPDVVVRSEHRLVIPLEKADLDRVAEIRGQLDSFKKITFEKYRKGWGR